MDQQYYLVHNIQIDFPAASISRPICIDEQHFTTPYKNVSILGVLYLLDNRNSFSIF